MDSKLIGKRAYIKTKKNYPDWNNEYRGTWGTIIDVDEDGFHIQMHCNGRDPIAPTLIFTRDEFMVRRD